MVKKAEAYLAKVDVTFIKNARVKDVSSQEGGVSGNDDMAAKAKIGLDNGTAVNADLYIPAFGTFLNTSFITTRSSSLLTPSHHIATNPSTLRVDAAGPRVYVIGDVSDYAAPSVHQTFAAVPVLIANMKHDLLAEAEEKNIDGEDRVLWKTKAKHN
jgi:pyruvate/2-oxoglutarate dehydrogenase complex dihydrolipoamide dehydrogenase (E3) component